MTLSASASDEITAFNGWTGSAAGTGNPLTLTVNSNMVVQAHFVGIKILSAPSNWTVNAGESATFSVTAAGTAPLAYQWYKDGVAIQGATDTNFTIASALAGDAGYYRLVITNMTGSLTSSVAVLTALAQNQKLLTDPGFELGGAAWSGSILRGGTGTVVTDAAVAHSGSNYFSAGPVGWASVVQGDAAGAYGTGVSLPITATDYYQLQAWVKVPGASTNPTPVTLRYRFEPSANRTDVGTQTINTENWTQLVSPWIQPASLVGGASDTFMCYFEVRSDNSGITMYVDDCVLLQSVALALITGRVVDGVGAGVDGATVLTTSTGWTPANTTTAAGGYYTFNAPPGTYTVSAAKSLYSSGSTSVTLSNGPATAPNITVTALPTTLVSGTVTKMIASSPVGVGGVVVSASFASGPPSVSAPSAANGSYSVAVLVGSQVLLSAAASGEITVSVPAPFTAPNTNPITGKNFQVADVPQTGSLLYALSTDDLPKSGTVSRWITSISGVVPAGVTFNTTPYVPTVPVQQFGGVTWEQNANTPIDSGFLAQDPSVPASLYTSPIMLGSGATIVLAAKPIRNTTSNAWDSIVDIFYNQLSLGIRNDNGNIMVGANDNTGAVNATPNNIYFGPAIPDRQTTIISLVVSNSGAFVVYTNGAQCFTGTATMPNTGAYTQLTPGARTGGNVNSFASYINLGREAPDSWSAYNGYIGDVYVYTDALAVMDRQALEAALLAKFITNASLSYTITASAGANGSISPSGATPVIQGNSQNFTMTANSGCVVTNVLVDNVSVGPVTSYSFTNVSAAHTIAASFIALPLKIITPPTASAITYGQTLASSILSGGLASAPGVFAFVIPNFAPNAGITNVSVIFIPTDTTNYNTAITNVNVTVLKAAATVNLVNLTQSYDGRAKPVTASTVPGNLTVGLTYNGSSAVPTNAGIYAVIGTISDGNFQGSATNTLVIGRGTATVTLGGLYQDYDGGAKCANASTTPPGLPISLTYDGSTTCPSAVGGYSVIGTVNEANYQGSTTNTLTIYAVAPVIVQQPRSQAVESGSNTTLTVVATGGPLNYQWFKDGTALTGTTSSALSFNPIALTNAGICFVVVSNSSGVAVSSNAVLAVRPRGAPILRVDGDLVVGSVSLIGSASVTMVINYGNGEIFYTLDGSAPDFGSALYGGAIILSNNAVVRALGLNLDTFDSAEAPAVTVNIQPNYGLILTTNGNGTVAANPSPGPYASNTVVRVTATAAAAWYFDHWTGDASGNENPVAVTMDGPRNVQAVFGQAAYPVVATTAGGGSVAVSPMQANYLSNTVVTVTATASNGWTFLGWRGSASGTNNPLNLAVDAPESLAAVFGTTVSSSVIGGGTIELNATNPIAYGSIVRATAMPNGGCYFVSWGSVLSGTNNPAEFTVTTTNPVRALFVALPARHAALTVRINGQGDATVSPRKAYYAVGDSVTLAAIPRGTTNQFVSWGGDFVSSANPVVLNLNTNKVVTANFSPLVLPPAITSSLTETGLVGTVFSYQITAANNPASYGASGLPLGLSVNTTNGVIAGTPESAGSYVITISASNPGGTGSASLALGSGTPVFPPTIIQSPSDQTVASGATVTFSVLASGTTPFTYQWHKGGFSLPDATNTILVLANVSSSDAAAYHVVVVNAYGSATSAVGRLSIYDAPAARIFLVPTNGTSGQTITVSVHLAALGNENALSFSLTFDPSLLSYQSVALGSGVSGGSLLANTAALGAGQLGLGISLGAGAGFSNTTQEVATVRLSLKPVAATTSAILGFGDQPTVRLVAATNARALAATFQGVNIGITPADYEGDVYPAGVGDHVLDIRDWIHEGLLVAGLETVTNRNEFLRADCAPLADKGDGILTVADWVQVGRFAVGLDPVTVVDGPIASKSSVPPLVKRVPRGQSPGASAIWISSTTVVDRASVELPVFLSAVGNENAAGFSVSFDSARLTLSSVTAGSGAGNATFIANTNGAANGQVGVAVSLSSGGAWGEGSQEMAVLAFKINPGSSGVVPVSLSDTVVQREVADATAQSLAAVYSNGVISITPPPQLSIALVGTNLTLSWPAAFSNYVLQSVGNLGAGDWNSSLVAPSLNGTNLFMSLPVTNLQQFYRLSK